MTFFEKGLIFIIIVQLILSITLSSIIIDSGALKSMDKSYNDFVITILSFSVISIAGGIIYTYINYKSSKNIK